jgi:ABC-type multidrug transport system fused ATPase/permease subunit
MKVITDILSLLDSGNKIKIFVIVFAILINSFLETLGIALIYPLIIFLMEENFLTKLSIYDTFNFFLGKSNVEVFNFLLVFIVSVTLLKVFSQLTLTRLITNFSAFQEAQLSISLLRKYLYSSYLSIIKKDSSNIINELTNFTGRFISQILNPILVSFSDIIILIMVSIFLVFLDIKTYILSLIFLSLFFIFYTQVVKKKIIRYGKELNEVDSNKIKIIQQIFKSIKNFKLSGNQSIFFNNYINYSNKRARNTASYKVLLDLPRLFLEFLLVLIFSISLFYLKKKNLSNYEIITLISVYAVCFIRLMPIINRLIFNYNEFKYGNDVLFQLTKIKQNFDTQEQEISLNEYHSIEKVVIKEVLFNNVNFEYTPGINVLEKVNFKIESGERIGIFGKTGSGKTTLVDILCGLIKPAKGSVLINNKNIYFNLNIFRNSIGYVPQVVFLNNDKLINNIAFGVEKKFINKEKINQIIDILNLETLVNSLPNGLDSEVGENGFNLSGGQRQRIGIARSLYHEPSLLIFDEATNSLDDETEKLIFKKLTNYFKDIIFIMITHKEKNLRYCSRVLRVNNSQVFEEKI